VRTVLPRLTSLRAFAALGVFLFHLGRWHAVQHSPLPFGYAGVTFFFILSGFVLTWSTAPGTPAGRFYRRRVARIYPSHLALLVLALALPVSGPVSVRSVLASLFLVQAWIPRGDITFGLNGVAWSLSCEAAFYLALPFVLAWLDGRGVRAARWLAGVAFVGGSAVTVVAAVHGGTWAVVAFTHPVLRFGEFLLGVVAAREVRSGLRVAPGLVVAAAVVGLGVVLAGDLPLPLPDLVLTPLFLTGIVLAAQTDLTDRRGWLVSRPLIYAGQVSFAFYLVHELVLTNLLHVRDARGLGAAVPAFAAAAILAVVVHHGVERPAQRRLSHPGRRAASDGPPLVT
jgi:peptidoglycan/LPS O-acetylase OafA/YrhL